jgi:membrane-bound lytic murein transglycosylase
VIRLLGIAALTLFAGAAAAQENPRESPRRGRPREEIFRMVDEYVAANLQEKLGLTDDQLGRALPLVRRLHADRRRFAERRMRALHQMKKMSRAGAINDARAAELLQSLKAAESEEAPAVRAGQDALDAVLTPAQQLKYRILETEIEHRLRELMARVRAQRGEEPDRRRGEGTPHESPAPH